MVANYPSALPSYGENAFHKTNNLGSSTTTSAINNASTTFTITDAAATTTWPTTNFVVRIEDELIFVSSRTGVTCTIGARNYGGTAKIDHSSGVQIRVVITADYQTKQSDEIIAIATELGLNPKGVYADVATRLADAVYTARTISTSNGLSGGGNLGSDRTLSWNGLGVRKAGAAVGTRRSINFVDGSTVTITVTDDSANDEVDITINTTGLAPSSASYVVIGTDATLTAERVLTAGTKISISDGGAGNAVTVAWVGADIKKAGVTTGTRRGINFIEGTNITITTADDAGNDEVDVTIAAGALAPSDAQFVVLAVNGTLTNERVLTAGTGIAITDAGAGSTVTVAWNGLAVRKNTGGADVGTRRRLNFIEGANITLTIADDSGNDEINITIETSTSGWTDSGTVVHTTTSTDNVAIGQTTASAKLVVNAGTTGGSDGILLDIAQPLSGQRNSHTFIMRSTSFDSAGHNADWKLAAKVTNDAGTNSNVEWFFRTDAGSFDLKFGIDNTGAVYSKGGMYPGDDSLSQTTYGFKKQSTGITTTASTDLTVLGKVYIGNSANDTWWERAAAANLKTTSKVTINIGTTSSDALFLDMEQPSSANQRDSHIILLRGTAYDTAGHNADWRMLVDVTSNAAASTFVLQSRIDATAFATRLSVSDSGVLNCTSLNVSNTERINSSGQLQLNQRASAPTTGQLASGYAEFAVVSGSLRFYYNHNGTIKYVELTA